MLANRAKEFVMSMESYFGIKAQGSTIGREIVGGATTFVALSYIIFVQPAVLSNCGMDKSAVMFATCVCSAFACLIMGLWGNLPIALAPAMGHNFFFAFTVCGATAVGGFGLRWQEGLAANFIAGILFLALSVLGLRGAIMNAIPEGLKFAIACGIGLLIALIGLEWAGIVVDHPATYVTLGKLINPVTLLSMFGLLVISVLLARRVHGAILLGMCITAVAGYIASQLKGGVWGYDLVVSPQLGAIPNVSATAGKVFGGLATLLDYKLQMLAVIVFTFLLLDVFDTIGTLVGLGERAGLMQDGQLPRARRALMADALGTLSGTMLGTSTITSYVESSAGIAAGARTGLASVVTAVLLGLSVFAYPLVEMFGSVVAVPVGQLSRGGGEGMIFCYPVVAPVLIVIGCYMMPMVRKIDWDDFSEAIPAFLTIVIMQLSFSITDGIAWGFVSYAILKLLTGKIRQCPIVVYLCAVLFILYYIFGRG